VAGGLDRTDRVMTDSFFLGVYPGLTEAQLDFTLERIQDFFRRRPG
jgi:CDP-6-deoxy-D-xylo-4-hexulose-3-dehydrase